ncbi:MAG: NAD(P)H-hydrate dehydratase [Nitrospirae bacterium]|nr:NAD(P)H-hydrate dehydratase [Nitrospirota bacterium]
MKVVTAEEMRNIDRATIGKYGIPGTVLMERAGLAVAEKIRAFFDKKKVIVLAGGGNNGGDGIAAARNLHNWGWHVRVLLMLRENKLSPDCLAQYRMAKHSGVAIEFRKAVTEKDLHGSLVIDALLGTGLNRDVASFMADVIRFLNTADVRVVAVDIPSGISSDSGQVMGTAVLADHTITFGLPKTGHFLHPGAHYSGKLHVEDIGFPETLLSAETLAFETIEKESAALLIPERPGYSHKGDYGHVLVIAGSPGKTGAALMTARACLRAGAGLVTIGIPETLLHVFQSRVTEEMLLPLPDTGKGAFSAKAYDQIRDFLDTRADVLAIGPGLTADKDAADLVKRVLETVTVPMVLDADAINVLAGRKDLLRKVKAPVILTPHAGEMARLLTSVAGRSAKDRDNKELRGEIERNRIDLTRATAVETGAYFVLKGSPTIVADPEGRIFINTTGNPGMATAGSGDVLTGMLAGLLGQDMHPVDACRLAVLLHGLAGDTAAEARGMHSLIASDIIEAIPLAFLSLRAYHRHP